MIQLSRKIAFAILSLLAFQTLAADLPCKIELLSSSHTAFVGDFERGPYNSPVRVKSWDEFLRRFSSKSSKSVEEEQVRLFFENGGLEASIVRIKKTVKQSFHVAPLSASSYIGDAKKKTGVFALDLSRSPMGLLVFPGANNLSPLELLKLQKAALDWAETRNIFVLLNAPLGYSVEQALTWKTKLYENSLESLRAGAIYYPPFIQDTHLIETSGAIAGLLARYERDGIWKSPAGVNASLRGVDQLLLNLTPEQVEALTEEGINSLRILPGRGLLVWGARTLAGADDLSDDFKYIAVARTATAIRKSIYSSLSPALRNSIPTDMLQKNVGDLIESFLLELYQRRAFAGNSPQQAFFLRNEVSLPDRQQGLLNIMVGFAPQRPSEFTILPMQFQTKVAR